MFLTRTLSQNCYLLQQSLNFEIFNVVLLILSIIVVGNFLRDGKSNYLEGALCILVYLIIGKSVAKYLA